MENLLGKKLKEERRRQKLTQQKLAELAGVSWRSIALVEQGRMSPSVNTLTKIAAGLGVGPAYFLS